MRIWTGPRNRVDTVAPDPDVYDDSAEASSATLRGVPKTSRRTSNRRSRGLGKRGSGDARNGTEEGPVEGPRKRPKDAGRCYD